MEGQQRIGAALVVLLALVASLALPVEARATFPGRNGLIAVHTMRDWDQMWVVRPDGSGLTRLPVLGFGAFAPDGRSLALAGETELAITDLNGGNSRLVLKSGSFTPWWVAWSPLGDLIYFTDPHRRPLYSIAVNGGSIRTVLPDASEIDVSVTGELAYAVLAVSGPSQLFTSDANGTNVHSLGSGESPSWSPDGTTLAYVKLLSGSTWATYIANADGSDARLAWNGRAGDLAWSPDGTQLALIRDDRVSVLDLASGTFRDILRAKQVDPDLHEIYGLEWQALQGNDQIVLPTAPPLGPCDMLGSRTVLKTKDARVFHENGYYYGCLYRLNRRFTLVDEDEVEGVVAIRSAGPYVGLALEVGDPSELVGFAKVVDLRSGHTKYRSWAVGRVTDSDIYSLVVTRTGAVAWIGRAFTYFDRTPPAGCKPYMRHYCNFPYEVHKADRTKTRLLETGHAIRPTTLKLHGRRVSWMNGRTRHSALLR